MNPAPRPLHNDIASRLAVHLAGAAAKEWRVSVSVGVLLDDRDPEATEVIPDVVVYSTQHDRSVTPIPASRVLLVAEVVSPGSTRKDRVSNPARYAQAAIPWFWRVETSMTGGPSVGVYRLAREYQVYEEVAAFDRVLSLAEPFAVTFDVPELEG